jgi:hypothetical protein
MTLVDRQTRCFLSIAALANRTQELAQQMVDQVPVDQYYSDRYALYDSLDLATGPAPVAGGQERNLLGRRRQCGVATLSDAAGPAQSLLLALSGLVESSPEGLRSCVESAPTA